MKESLVVPRKPEELEKFEQRIEEFARGDEAGRPAGTELATSLTLVELGEPKDRLSLEVFELYDRWTQEPHVVYEIEVQSFIPRASAARREVESIIGEIRLSLRNGLDGAIYEHDLQERGARIVLWTTGAKLREFVEDRKWWRKIVFFDGRPKFETFSQVFQDFSIDQIRITAPPANAETICVIDTGVAAGNPFLEPVLRADLSRSFVRGFSPTADPAGHGSAVASLAAYYELAISENAENAASCFVVSARITDDKGQFDVPWIEDDAAHRVAEARLLSNVLRDIVQHYQPLGIRVFVLAFQIVGHVWSKATRRSVARNAWVARTIDQLSRDDDVVFVAITGNVAPDEVEELLGLEAFPQCLLRPLAKIHDPGQAALALTVGSIAHAAKVVVAPLMPIALESQPSPFTRSGPGFGESNKPDLVNEVAT